jgi:hypothetical protein
MTRRIKAMRITFNLLLTAVELLIGLRFLMEAFAGEDTIDTLVEDVGSILGQIGYVTSEIGEGIELTGAVSVLVLSLAFMGFCYFLLMAVPRIVERVEENIDVEFD